MRTDIDIAQEFQNTKAKPINEVGISLGLKPNDLELYGNYKAKLSNNALKKYTKNEKLGKLILTTSINPTPAGEGKSTMAIALADALSTQTHKKSMLALREPSLGPVMGLKGGATGGGQCQVVPMEDINLHFTGDLHALTSAINTLAALIDNHMQQGNALNLDSRQIMFKRSLDVNDRVMRHVLVGMGGRTSGVPREESFQITAANELMAILCLATGIDDLKNRIGQVLVGYTYEQTPVYVKDLNVQGAITVLLKDAIKPNLVQTLEHTPALIHGGPFANIAHGTNSVIATTTALNMADYVVTEAGFGADLGGEKYNDFVSQLLPKSPDVSVIVATVRALKYHGGQVLSELKNESVSALEIGFANLKQHIENMQKFNIPVVVAINAFASDTSEELRTLKQLIVNLGVKVCIVDAHQNGSIGAKDLAETIIEVTDNQPVTNAKRIYDNNESIEEKVKHVAREIYRAKDVAFSKQALNSIKNIKQNNKENLPIIIAKTQSSFSDDPKQLNVVSDFTLQVRDVDLKSGAGFIVVYAGSVLTMPGLSKHPAALDIDIDSNGKISGLF
ncbi:formate--tetrahydrofolate ligase [Holzapfeliella floricola]|uniref:Formate--tetrahydrofolate ligase n=1 Tax=Holzapfeliella floricola DSM 23037 = JCM 16512 TaxID=1423744 RepID=A0A0R2DHZ0_9LACO|nr:formate--tetrahydrofolate ligase [Holzapfeliella floricola]KRN03713.1 fhs1 protein [Holzapfeliella floricola DSM 23037 = JCM 16512]